MLYSAIMELNEIFGKNLKRRQEASGLSVEELAKRAGMAYKSVYDYINCEKMPGIDKVAALAEVLGCTPWEMLFHGSPNEDIPKLIERFAETTPETQAFVLQVLQRDPK